MFSCAPEHPQSALWRRAARRGQPLNAHLELTYACNWQCAFCYVPADTPLSGLGTSEWIGVLDELRALGTLVVSFTGGEPLVHPGFLAIARAARERALAIRVLSNGSLVDEEMADALAALQPLGVELSLHGAQAATHDGLTRRPGSFEATLAGARRLQARGVRLVLKTVLARQNEHELEALIAQAARLGVPWQVDPEIVPRDDGNRNPLGYRASLGAVEKAYGHVAEGGRLPCSHRQAGGDGCAIARTTLAVDPEGRVLPCLRWRHEPLGNVRETPLRELWEGSAVRQRATVVARQANERLIELGEPNRSFPYCPASARAETGDPLVPAPFHTRLAEIACRIRNGIR